MRVDVVTLPSLLREGHIAGRSVVVFDVLRATTTMAAALSAGAREVRVFGSIELAREAAAKVDSASRLLCGEEKCLAPVGFDLGNSPRDYTKARVSGKTIYLSTTNGTRAIVAARGAQRLFAAAVLNAGATAGALVSAGLDVTLLCAGTGGEIAPEDLIGAGAVASHLRQEAAVEFGKETIETIDLFQQSAKILPATLRTTQGGKNIMAAKLDPDIDFAARLDALDIVVEVSGDPPIARRMIRA